MQWSETSLKIWGGPVVCVRFENEIPFYSQIVFSSGLVCSVLLQNYKSWKKITTIRTKCYCRKSFGSHLALGVLEGKQPLRLCWHSLCGRTALSFVAVSSASCWGGTAQVLFWHQCYWDTKVTSVYLSYNYRNAFHLTRSASPAVSW